MFNYPEDIPRKQVDFLVQCYGQLAGAAHAISDPRAYMEYSGESVKTRIDRVKEILKGVTVKNDIEEIIESLRNFPSQMAAAVIHSHCMLILVILAERISE